MNELLIAQAQQAPVRQMQARGKTDVSAKDAFGRLVWQALEDRARPKVKTADGEEAMTAEMYLGQWMSEALKTAGQPVPPQEQGTKTAVLTAEVPAAGTAVHAAFAELRYPGESTMPAAGMAEAGKEVAASPVIEAMPANAETAGTERQAAFGGQNLPTEPVVAESDGVLEQPAMQKPAMADAGVNAPPKAADLPEAENAAETLPKATGAETPEAAENGADAGEQPRQILLSELQLNALGREPLEVKVGEAYQIADPEFDGKLAETILYRAENGLQEFEIQLEPREIGKVKINLTFEDGRAVVSLVCENAKAERILGSHIDGIRALIANTTRSETEVYVEKNGGDNARREDPDGGNQPRQQQEQRQQQKPKREEVSYFLEHLKMDLMTVQV